MSLVGRGPNISTPFREPESGVPEELMTPVVPVKVAPGRSSGVLGPTYHGDGNPLSELEMQKSALKLEKENKEKVRVETQPTEPSEEERLAHEATHIPFQHWCESCVEAKSKQDHEKKNPEAGKDSVGVPYPIIQLDFMFLQGKDTPALVAICSWTRMPSDRGQSQDEQLEEVLDMLHTDLSASSGGRVSQEEDVFHWDEHEDLTAVEGEDVEYEDLIEEEMEDAPKNEQGESPPELSPEELDVVDQQAAVEELNRLSKIGVIEEFIESKANGTEKRMDLREVYDWRYRDDQWKRRCRIVAREYRAGAASTAETFSPTASSAAARLVLILHLLNPTWVILVLDIKDAYLQVPQQEEVLVTISEWMKKDSEKTVYGLWKSSRKYSESRRK
ncbi:unnamed protein product, partial [Symbiodinium microadriaticum]